MGYFDDPNLTMALLNMGAGFGQAAMPTRMPVPTGAALGMGAAGLAQGMQAGQQYTSADTANQIAKLGLQKQQAVQPLQIGMIQKVLGGLTGTPGSLNGQMPSSQFTNVISKPTAADARYAQAYDLSMAFAPEKAPEVLDHWAANTPELAGAKKLSEAQNSVNQTPDGPIFGVGGIPGSSTGGSPAGSIPPVAASQLQPPKSLNDIIAEQTKTPSYNPMSIVSVAAAKKSVENAADIAATEPKAEQGERGKNIAESDKAVAAVIGRLPSAFGIVDDMSKLAPDVPFGPGAENQRDFYNMVKSPKATAYDRFNKFNENLFTQELPAIVQNSGGRIDIPLVKAIQGASQVPLDAQPETKKQLLNDTKGLLSKVRDNALQNYKAQTGKDFDLGKAFDTPPSIKNAFKRGVIDQATAERLLQKNHGFGQ